MPSLSRLLILLLCLLPAPLLGALGPAEARSALLSAALSGDAKHQLATLESIVGRADEAVLPILASWREDSLFIYEPSPGVRLLVVLTGEKDASDAQASLDAANSKPLLNASGGPLRLAGSDLIPVEHNSQLRRAMKAVIDMLDLVTKDPVKRLRAVQVIGNAQDVSKISLLKERLSLETDAAVAAALREALALAGLKSKDAAERREALTALRGMKSIASSDFIKASRKEALAAGRADEAELARTALLAIERHTSWVNFWGTLFRGVSLGSILLVVALGLAITFGLMKVINMAHGEMIAVGAYTTYLVENVFGPGLALSPFGHSISLPGLHATGAWYQSYFLFALPMSFMTAACVGILLERTVIRFLYRRPLESLLATWGVSLVLQQLFKLIFGANNVQVSSPSWLSGNWTVGDIIFGWNRVFVIGFAGFIVLGTWLVLTRTPLGLLIRAVMQNRSMASCMGVRTERVNMLTFGLGSGLAGLAGAFLSQIGNVGPALGQNYIVDCFMTVVVGGVGNLGGTVISAFGIGLTDQSLQQILLNPVLGKILVLAAIILFLQWRPAGIFVTRSRSLDE